MKVHIVMGLPGSGKSTWVVEETKDGVLGEIIDLDRKRTKVDWKWFKDHVDGRINGIYVDGLFTTNDQILALIKEISKEISNSEFFIHYWIPDRERCVKNDLLRGREKRAKFSIETLPIDDPRKNSEIRKLATIKIHDVYQPTDADLFALSHANVDKFFLESQCWSLGGECWDYTGVKWLLPADNPKEFDELDDLLLEIWPNIGLLQYKKIKKIVEIKESREDDYYSDVMEARHIIDLRKLYTLIQELKGE